MTTAPQAQKVANRKASTKKPCNQSMVQETRRRIRAGRILNRRKS